MERRDHIIMISAFVIVAIIFLVSAYVNNITGNVVLDSNELSLINCKEEDNWKVCDIQYPNEEIREEAYKEKIV